MIARCSLKILKSSGRSALDTQSLPQGLLEKSYVPDLFAPDKWKFAAPFYGVAARVHALVSSLGLIVELHPGSSTTRTCSRERQACSRRKLDTLQSVPAYIARLTRVSHKQVALFPYSGSSLLRVALNLSTCGARAVSVIFSQGKVIGDPIARRDIS